MENRKKNYELLPIEEEKVRNIFANLTHEQLWELAKKEGFKNLVKRKERLKSFSVDTDINVKDKLKRLPTISKDSMERICLGFSLKKKPITVRGTTLHFAIKTDKEELSSSSHIYKSELDYTNFQEDDNSAYEFNYKKEKEKETEKEEESSEHSVNDSLERKFLIMEKRSIKLQESVDTFSYNVRTHDDDSDQIPENIEDEEYEQIRTKSVKVKSVVESESSESLNGIIEYHFIDVGSLGFGGIFGLGEKSHHRVIIARTKVQCFMVPRFWLFSARYNPGNIWHRKRYYVSKLTPSREEIFDIFLKSIYWQQFKDDFIQSKLKDLKVINAKPEDLPIYSKILDP